jgi:hypothetical protein
MLNMLKAHFTLGCKIGVKAREADIVYLFPPQSHEVGQKTLNRPVYSPFIAKAFQ